LSDAKLAQSLVKKQFHFVYVEANVWDIKDLFSFHQEETVLS